MRCIGCRRLSLAPLCRNCRELYLTPRPKIRKLPYGLEVLSFFSYEEIEPLLLRKHTLIGWSLYRQLARRAFAHYPLPEGVVAVAVDDVPHGGYSHTALLARILVPKRRLLIGALRAQNAVSYAGKSLAYRLAHPRGFCYRGPVGVRVLLVDDIVTTGTTLTEAADTLQKGGAEAVGAVVLADASR